MWKRVVAPTVLVSVLWIAASMISTVHFQRIYESHGRTLSENVATIDSAWAMRRHLWRLHATMLEASQRETEQTRAELKSLESAFEASLAEAERTSLTPQEQQISGAIRQQFDEYKRHIHAQIDQANGNGKIELSPAEWQKNTQLAAAVADSSRKLTLVNRELINNAVAQNQQAYRAMHLVRIIFMITGPVVGLVCGLWVARGLNRSLAKIRITLKDATGTLGCELGSVAVSADDDLPALQRQVENVTGRIRQVVDELEDVRRRAIQSERLAAVGELAAGVAHEIRNPLTSVKLLIQTASQRKPNPGLSEKQFEVVLREISRMEGTIQGLLDFARPARLRRVAHDVRQTVRRAMNLIHGRAEHQKVTISEDLPTCPVLVDGDPEQLHLVFVNLAINGVEAMSGGGTLSVSVKQSMGICRIIFTDTGPGIPPHVLSRIFEPFVTNKDRGTGLGLAISRRVVQEHGGTLLAANSPGGGAMLSVDLPCKDSAAVAADPEVGSADVAPAEPSLVAKA